MFNKSECTVKILSSLAKVFLDEKPDDKGAEIPLSALRGETVSFQVAYLGKNTSIRYGKILVKSDIEKAIRVRQVISVPSSLPTHTEIDKHYITNKAGLFPDLLRDLDEQRNIRMPAGRWSSLFIDIEVDDSLLAGEHEITIAITDIDGQELGSATTSLHIYNTRLMPQKLIRTEWFHADCLADYYKVSAWSEEHWRIVDNFIKTAVDRGINMILTPIHTPPLDTYIGGEITTVQLVDVIVDSGKYSFKFDKLKRFVDICLKNGVKYFEMAHLFTQWGAKFAPKIIATVDGVEKRIFGWDTPAVGGEYTVFLNQYIPAIREKLAEWGIEKNTYFHISDEPNNDNVEEYSAAKNSVDEALTGTCIIDALSSYEFYKKGIIKKCIPCNDHIQAFVDNGVENLWTYYCTSQSLEVSNRFMAMPSERNRIIGVQMYLYNIEGFLQWGYNFYNSHESRMQINPYIVTDAMMTFPSGDAFMVYPGENGMPEESLRLMVFYEAVTDLTALQMLEELTCREYVEGIVMEGVKKPITFKEYPHNAEYILNLRKRVNEEIQKHIK